MSGSRSRRVHKGSGHTWSNKYTRRLAPIFHCVMQLVAPPGVQYVIVDAHVSGPFRDNNVTQIKQVCYLREPPMLNVKEIAI